jgi:hypothetical protein
MNPRVAQFIAIIATALAQVPVGAHLLALPNKIGLDQDRYMTVQAIYRGWALLGIILIAAIVANLIVTVMIRKHTVPARLAAAATVLMALTLVIFFVWTFPANQATGNWTVAPADWRTLRARWEYSHALNAVLTFLALCATTLSAMSTRD